MLRERGACAAHAQDARRAVSCPPQPRTRLDTGVSCGPRHLGCIVGLTGQEPVHLIHVELAASSGFDRHRYAAAGHAVSCVSAGLAKLAYASTERGRLDRRRAPARPGLAQALGLIGVHGQDGAALEAAPQQLHRVRPDALERAALHRVGGLLGVHARLPPGGPPCVSPPCWPPAWGARLPATQKFAPRQSTELAACSGCTPACARRPARGGSYLEARTPPLPLRGLCRCAEARWASLPVSARRGARLEQDFSAVDVADAGNHGLVHQHQADRLARGLHARPHALCVRILPQRVRAQLGRQRGVQVCARRAARCPHTCRPQRFSQTAFLANTATVDRANIHLLLCARPACRGLTDAEHTCSCTGRNILGVPSGCVN